MPESGSEETVDERLARLERELAELRASRRPEPNQPDPIVFGPFTGTDVDLDGVLGAAKADQVRSILEQFAPGRFSAGGLSGNRFGGAFGAAAPVATKYLADPPRRVPLAFRLAALSWKWWEAFAILMTLVAPIAVWLFLPMTLPIPFLGLLLVVAVLRLRSLGNRSAVLKWGKVATVTAVNQVSVGTYFSGVTYNNVRLAQAHGWDVERRWYSGPGHTTDIEYTVDGNAGRIRMRGLPYTSGVILASIKDPSKALCVSDFPYDLDVDSNGNWVPSVRPTVWIGACATILLYAGLVAGAVLSISATWLS